MAMNLVTAAALGALGGVLPDIIKIVRKRFQKRPNYLGTWYYWGNFLLLGAAGAAVSAYRDPRDVVEAVAYGAAALTFITQLLALPDDKHLGSEAEREGFFTRIRRWWGS